jgi:predicted ATP-dependent serine protease
MERKIMSVEEFPKQKEKTGLGVQVVTMSDVEATEIEWVWLDHIPRGKLSIFVGDPGVGKSLLSCSIASSVSTGTTWPVNGAPCNLGDAVMLCGEDDLSDTVKPRLEAAGADCARIHAITMVHALSDNGDIDERVFSLDKDLKELERVLDSLEDPQIVTIDPINNYIGTEKDSYKDTEVRSILAPLKDLAERKNVAIVLFGHMNKNSGAKAMYRMIGSIGFIGIARISFLVTKDPDPCVST